MDKIKNIYFPKWATILYTALALILVPWIFSLAQSLPTRHTVRHWDAVWVGFDVIVLATIIITVWFVIRKRIWAIVSAGALATLFIVDAWFDIMTSRPGQEQRKAIFFGLLEVTLAIFTYRFIYLVISRSTTKKNIRFRTKNSRKKNFL